MSNIGKRIPDILGILLVFVISGSLFITPAQTLGNTPAENPKKTENIISDYPSPTKPENTYECLGEFRISAYCPCEICCGVYANDRPTDLNGNKIVIGAGGVQLKAGVSIAADTDLFPFGTELIIDGKTYVVQDRGGSIKGNKIDIYFNNHNAAAEYGIKYKNVYIEREIKNEQTAKSYY